MASIEIRRASRGDIPTLATVGQQVFWDTYGSISDPDDVEQHVAEYFSSTAVSDEIAKPDVDYFMAMSGPDCAGLVKLRGTEVPASVAATTALEVQQLYVHSDFQRIGVGKLLMDRAVVAAEDRGVEGIWLSVWVDAPWATSFYRKYGFTQKGQVVFTIGSSDYDDYVMWLQTGG